VPATKLICIDCDSTLSAIEGIDELARLRGSECFAAIERMTRDAMDGHIALDDIFAKRLELIRPTRAETEAVGAHYIREIEPTAQATVAVLKETGWTVLIVSGGYTQAIEPLARHLGIARIEAVPLRFDAVGAYAGYDTAAPASRRGGKPEIMRALRAEFAPARLVMVGDGASDAETRADVDQFIAFERYVERPAVRAAAHHRIRALEELPAWLARG
jgi:phosphoserine phosphatase